MELELLRRSQEAVPSAPPLRPGSRKGGVLQKVLERRTERSALLLRALLGKIRLEPMARGGDAFLLPGRVQSAGPGSSRRGIHAGDPEPGSNSLQWWRRRESNPRPEASGERPLHAQPLLGSRPAASRRGKTAARQPRIRFAAPSGDPERLHPHFATSAGARRVRSPDKRGYLIRQPERSCCCSQLLFSTLFLRGE